MIYMRENVINQLYHGSVHVAHARAFSYMCTNHGITKTYHLRFGNNVNCLSEHDSYHMLYFTACIWSDKHEQTM